MATPKKQQQPETVELEQIEILLYENLRLKGDNLKRELAAIGRKMDELKAQTEARLGIDDLVRYVIDQETGRGKRVSEVAQ